MGRYSLNLRDKYGRGEPVGGELIQRGIGDALDIWVREDEARRNERNEIARQGGVAVGTPPTAMDRIRGIGGAIKRNLRRTPNFNGDVTQTGALTGTSNARDGVEPSTPPSVLPPPAFTPSRAGERITPSFQFGDATMPGMTVNRGIPTQRIEDLRGEVDPADMRRRLDDAIHRNGGYSDDSQDSGHGMQVIPPKAMTSIATQPPPAANGAPQPSSNIGTALKTVYEGRNGQKYEIDPLRNKRAEIALDDEAARSREGRAQSMKLAEQERQIQAAVAAGMPEPEARARVTNNLMRYDQEFGQRSRGTMTQAERLEIENIRTARAKEANDLRLKIANLSAAGRQNSEEYRQAMLALATADLALKTADARADNFDRTASAAEGTIPTNPIDRRIAVAGGDSTRIAGAESTANANRDSAGRIRREGAATAESIAGLRTGGGVRDATAGTARARFTPEQTQSRAVALKNAGKSKQEVYEIMKAEGYNVAPPRP